jgi:hypothetical protein
MHLPWRHDEPEPSSTEGSGTPGWEGLIAYGTAQVARQERRRRFMRFIDVTDPTLPIVTEEVLQPLDLLDRDFPLQQTQSLPILPDLGTKEREKYLASHEAAVRLELHNSMTRFNAEREEHPDGGILTVHIAFGLVFFVAKTKDSEALMAPYRSTSPSLYAVPMSVKVRLARLALPKDKYEVALIGRPPTSLLEP